ncbi:MAG TPA: hypothetical protein VHE30_20530 [Polyangiaceae bacterium]|nr:hypothetical protein [Polyangiaceae bacterium]
MTLRVPDAEDERTPEDLRAENERLRKELLHERTRRPMWPVAAGLLVHILLRPLFDPWLNAQSDAKVAGALAILIVPLVFSGVMLVRALRAPE